MLLGIAIAAIVAVVAPVILCEAIARRIDRRKAIGTAPLPPGIVPFSREHEDFLDALENCGR
jgi:hypothetical protein